MKPFLAAVCTAAATSLSPAVSAAAAPPDPAATVPFRSGPAMVTFERAGGFAGRDDVVTVDEGGIAHVVSRAIDVRLSAAELGTLRGDLARVRTWWSSPEGCDVADHFTYTLGYGGRRATRCAVPCDWRPLVDQFEALLDRIPGVTGAAHVTTARSGHTCGASFGG